MAASKVPSPHESKGKEISAVKQTITYTFTDEAPMLATGAFLPIIRRFLSPAGVDVELSDISLAARILAQFSDTLPEDQQMPDNLAALGEMTQDPDANIIKLPNISATVSQLQRAISELQDKGYDIPSYPLEATTDEDKATRAQYAKALGSAVNPVLREGNSDRRAPKSVKEYARKNPHSMGDWSMASRTHVAHMRQGDCYDTEQSVTVEKDCTVRMEVVTVNGTEVLKPEIELLAGEIIDSQCLHKKALVEFYEQQMQDAHESDMLLSLHVKATMMKISDPIIFGHAVRTYYKAAFDKHKFWFDTLGVNVNNGLSDLYSKIELLPGSLREEVIEDMQACHANRPALAMVDSNKGITNLHAPNDVIIDASMPAMIRNGGKMYAGDGKLKDTKALIPESTFARIYQEIVNFCKTNGAFDPTTMGTVPNVGLMAKKAEEYGSHDKTYEIETAGEARIVDVESGDVLTSIQVEAGDIWRACQTKDEPVRDWVKLAVDRARASGMPALFWLDPYRPHENELIKKVETYLEDHDTDGLDIQVMSQVRAMRYTLERCMRGLDTISVTGNILRDYLTDLFPILELGTSAKMLSVVPLMKGGGLYETGAGGSAPKHVQQLTEENHLRWDSLGEYLALAASLDDLAAKKDSKRTKLLADALDAATGTLLDNGKGPSRRTGELDNRGSQFYLALYWAQELASQDEDSELKAEFEPIATALANNEDTIVKELRDVQGKEVDIGGYFLPDKDKIFDVMRPSKTLNSIIGD